MFVNWEHKTKMKVHDKGKKELCFDFSLPWTKHGAVFLSAWPKGTGER